ncbi:MAG: substrate-binding domain-containing protein, partial [Clostridia bacterium]
MYLLMQPLAEAYMKEHPGTFVVMTTTSSGSSARGLKSLLEGTSNIAMSTEDPDDLSMKMMMEKGITLERSVVGYDVVTPFVNNQNPISALTEDQLKQIY